MVNEGETLVISGNQRETEHKVDELEFGVFRNTSLAQVARWSPVPGLVVFTPTSASANDSTGRRFACSLLFSFGEVRKKK